MQQENGYDVIFMDLKMPGNRWRVTTQRILKDYPDVIIIGCTGQVEETRVRQCLKAGMRKCLGKPVQLDDLKCILEKYCSLINH